MPTEIITFIVSISCDQFYSITEELDSQHHQIMQWVNVRESDAHKEIDPESG